MRTISLAGALTVLIFLAACGGAGTDASSGHDHDHDFVFPAVETDLYWQLDSDATRLGFTSIKAGEIIENHTFSGLYGVVDPDGLVSIAIPLNSVETGIDLRNERMRDMFFQIDDHPEASIEVTIDPAAYENLNVGEQKLTEIEGALSLHGVQADLSAQVAVTRIGPDRIAVASAQPVIVYVDDFNLAPGLEALREIANLPAITPAIPVTFSLVFEAEHDEHGH